MGLIRVGSLWEKDFKNGAGFSGQLDAEELEKILQDKPDEAKINVLVFSNAKGLEKNDRAPNFNIYFPDGEDDRGSKDRSGGRGSAQEPRRESRDQETRVETRDREDTREPSNPLDDPEPKRESRRAAPPAQRPSSGRRSSSADGKRGYSQRSGRK